MIAPKQTGNADENEKEILNDQHESTSSDNSESSGTETILFPCFGNKTVRKNGDSLESFIDDYLKRDKKTDVCQSSYTNDNIFDIESENISKPSGDRSCDSGRNENTLSSSSHETSSTRDENAFLCNIPNAPPFILKMGRASSETSALPVHSADVDLDRSNPSMTWRSVEELLEEETTCRTFLDEDTSHIRNSVEDIEELGSFIDEMSGLNMFVDESCPDFENAEFKKFISKSVTWVKTEKENRWLKSGGFFPNSPTICMTGLTGHSHNPFGADEIDSRRSVRGSEAFPNSVASSSHHQSKIPRMLHPGRCKVRAKMKNVQLNPCSKCSKGGPTNNNTPKKCCAFCQVDSDKPETVIDTPQLKISVSIPCQSFTCPNGSAPAGDKGDTKKENNNIPASKTFLGVCVKDMKDIDADPGCFCGEEPVDFIPCPVRQREDEKDADEPQENAESNVNAPSDQQPPKKEIKPVCDCGKNGEEPQEKTEPEQPILLKKPEVECDCANKKKCENEPFEEPPEEKPDVFWALTKVTLLKDGSKNFEIIDVSPVPPGYYLMPDENNLVLVGPQPKPVQGTATPSNEPVDVIPQEDAQLSVGAPSDQPPLMKSKVGCDCEKYFKKPQENEESYAKSDQPPLMKSEVGCDCAKNVKKPQENAESNARRPSNQPPLMESKVGCENEPFVEPPQEKPDVFWAVKKVTLMKDGSKNFEILNVSPVPPCYYLMQDVNNLVVVGPQPRPVKGTSSKNCSGCE